MENNPKLNKLQNLLKLLDESLTRKEFEEAFKAILTQLLKLEQNLIAKIDSKTFSAVSALEEIQKLHKEVIQKIEKENESSFSNMRKWATEKVNELFVKYQIKEKIAEIDEKLANVRDSKDADEVKIVADVLAKIPPVKELAPETADQIRDKLETLKGSERLEIKAIKDLQEELDEIRKMKGKVVYTGGGSSGGHIVKVYDLSASLNGVLKTFTLPAFWRVISVQSSSFPNAFRPTTDYTTDAGAMTITFTSEINAAATLDTGQTLTVIYSE